MAGLIACLVIGLVILLLSRRGTLGRERQLIQLGLVAHLAGSAAIVAYHTYFAGGDMLGYAFQGRQLARLIETDFGRYAPEVTRLALHLDNHLPAIASYDDSSRGYLVGTTTTTMFALCGLVMFFVGDSLLAASVIFSLFAFAGTAFFYKSLRHSVEEHQRIPVLCSLMFVPSVVFWSSGIVKEAVLLGFFGLLCGGLYDILARRRLSAALFVVIGAIGVGLVKPYVFFPLALSLGAWLNARRRHLGWWTQLAAIAVALVALVALSILFPEFGIDRAGEIIAGQQSAGQYGTGAGSYIEVGAPEERSALGQLRYAPLALLNSLARPFLFEARNPSMLLASLETTTAAVLLASLVLRHGFRRLYNRIAEQPAFVAATVFAVSFGVAVGLTTTNLGTLSRYRLPMLPMYFGLLLALRARPGASPALHVDRPTVVPRERGRGLSRVAARRHPTPPSS